MVLASSMVVYGEGAYDCAWHGRVRPAPRRRSDLTAGMFDPRCPTCATSLQPTLVAEDDPLDPRSVYAATKLAQENPDLVKRFNAAMKKSLEYANSHPDEARAILASYTQIAPDVLDGTCPDMLQDMLEVRGLGVMNIRQMFGDTAVKRNKYLRLIVHLMNCQNAPPEAMARLTGETSAPRRVLDLDVPEFHLPVAPGRNLAVLTEAAVRLHILRVKGSDPAAAFLARHAALLGQSAPT